MLTSIQLMGGSMHTVTVSRDRHVFYSDGNAISYFRDDCGSQEKNAATACQKTGRVLLPKDSNMWVDRSISGIVITREYVNAQMTQRYLYAASTTTHSLYRLTVEISNTGEVSIPVPVWKSMTGGGYPDFVDGTFAAARFNTPSELEISPDDATLYVSDYANHRIRVLDLKTQMVRTLLGNGMPCWRTGLLDGLSLYPSDQATLDGSLCDGYVGARATAQRPMGIGLSRDGARLYVSMFDENSVGVVDGPEFRRLCTMDPNRIQNSGQPESCRTDLGEGRSCFLWKPFDVAATDQSLFVAVTNGVTKIDLQTLACNQVSGALWETTSTLSSGFVDGELLNETCSTSRVYNPFKMVFASDTGIMYVADMSNGAVRRIFIDGRCMCPEVSIVVAVVMLLYVVFGIKTKWQSRAPSTSKTPERATIRHSGGLRACSWIVMRRRATLRSRATRAAEAVRRVRACMSSSVFCGGKSRRSMRIRVASHFPRWRPSRPAAPLRPIGLACPASMITIASMMTLSMTSAWNMP